LCSNKYSALILILLLVISSYQSCGKGQYSGQIKNGNKTLVVTKEEIPKLISGVWYHKRGEMLQKPMQMDFSWGKTTVGYWNALVIDLFGSRQQIGMADIGWNQIKYEVSNEEANCVLLHLGVQGNPSHEEAKITLTAPDSMVFDFIGPRTGFTESISGQYYRAVMP